MTTWALKLSGEEDEKWVTLTEPEQWLYEMVDAYLQRSKKAAFPKMEQYDLTLMLFRTFSSSTFALEKTLQGVVKRLEVMDTANASIAAELAEVRQMHTLAKSIKENAKGKELLTALKTGFAELKKRGANKKALIFTENRTTQKYIFSLLECNGYEGNVLLYSGETSRDYTVMERFEKEAQILVTTDIAAEGFNLEFCSFVVNYDLPYDCMLLVCLAEGITVENVEAMADFTPAKIILAESGLADDTTMSNAYYNLTGQMH